MSGGGGKYQRRRTIERWEQMTPDERERFRQGLHGRAHCAVGFDTECVTLECGNPVNALVLGGFFLA
jgi:hypothetical protein